MIIIKIQSEMMTMHNVNLIGDSIADSCATEMTKLDTEVVEGVLLGIEDYTSKAGELVEIIDSLCSESDILEDKLSQVLKTYRKGIMNKTQMRDIFTSIKLEINSLWIKIKNTRNELKELREGKYHTQLFEILNTIKDLN